MSITSLGASGLPEDPIDELTREKCKGRNLSRFQTNEMHELISALLSSNNNYCPDMRWLRKNEQLDSPAVSDL